MILKKYMISATAVAVLTGSMASQGFIHSEAKEETVIEKSVKQSGVSISVSDKTIKKGSKFNPKAGVTAKDYNGKDITKYIIVTHNNVNENKVGTYKVGYAVLGSNGKRVDVEITVKVISSENETFKTIIDANDISISKGSTFSPLKGVKATDVTGLDITRHLLVTKNDVKTNTPGVYDVTYLVLDTQGNRVYKTIKVTVVGESNTPELEKKTEILVNDITLNTGDVFKEKEGVKAIDVTGLDITMHILVTKNNVNTNRAGDYEVTYLVLDTQGNRIYKTIKVKVVGDPIITDKEQAQTVKEMIEALKDESSIELSDEDKVIEAREAYDKLSEEAKALVTNIDKLEKIEAKLKIEKDKIIAKELEVKIASLKEESLIELEDEAVLVEIREAYNNLSPEAKILVTSIEKLETAETKLAELKKIENDKRTAKEVEDKIASLDRELEYADKVMIDAVRKEYEALSDEAKLLVPNLDVLERVEKEIETILNNVTNVFNLIGALPEEIELTHKAQVEEARQAYEDLSANEKKAVTKEILSILENSELKIKELEALDVNKDAQALADKIAELMDIFPIEKEHIAEIEALRPAYEQLSPEGKKLVHLPFIEELEQRALELNTSMAKEVEDMITALKDESLIELADEDEVIEAREAYENLTESAKKLVTNLDKLERVEAKLKEEKDKVIAKEIEEKLATIQDESSIELEHEELLVEIRESYNSLGEDAKLLVVSIQKLETAETRLAELKKAKDIEDKIASLDRDLVYSDKVMIQALRKEYEALNPETKALVKNIHILERVEQEIIDIFEKVSNVIQLISSLPEEIELSHRAQVEEARRAYDGLDERQQKEISKELLSILISSELKIQELEANTDAQALLDKITELLDKVVLTEDDRADVESLRPAYEKLSPEGKKLVSLSLIEELEMRMAGIY